MSATADVWARPGAEIVGGAHSDVRGFPYGPDATGSVFTRAGGARVANVGGGSRAVSVAVEGGAQGVGAAGGSSTLVRQVTGGSVRFSFAGAVATFDISRIGGAALVGWATGVRRATVLRVGGAKMMRVSGGVTVSGSLALRAGGANMRISGGGHSRFSLTRVGGANTSGYGGGMAAYVVNQSGGAWLGTRGGGSSVTTAPAGTDVIFIPWPEYGRIAVGLRGTLALPEGALFSYPYTGDLAQANTNQANTPAPPPEERPRDETGNIVTSMGRMTSGSNGRIA